LVKRTGTHRRVVAAVHNIVKGLRTDGRIVDAVHQRKERIAALGRVTIAIVTVRWWGNCESFRG